MQLMYIWHVSPLYTFVFSYRTYTPFTWTASQPAASAAPPAQPGPSQPAASTSQPAATGQETEES